MGSGITVRAEAAVTIIILAITAVCMSAWLDSHYNGLLERERASTPKSATNGPSRSSS
jgi:hypothetical protein